MSKIIIITLILSFLATNSLAQFKKLEKRKHSVNRLLKEIIEDNDFKNADFAFYAVDGKSGEVISSYHPDKSLMPASNQKLVTTAAALELFGPDFRFSTRLEFSGSIDTINHVLNGDIVIKGGGDPTLGSKYFDATKDGIFLDFWLAAIENLGIDSIAGAIIADPEIFGSDIVPSSWSWDDMGNYYGAGASGLSVYDNSFSIFFNTSGNIGDTVQIVKVFPEIPELVFDNKATVDSIDYDNLYIYGAPYSFYRALRGELPQNKVNFIVSGSMPDPAYIAACELYKKLIFNGIAIKDSPTTTLILSNQKKNISRDRTLFLELYSPTLAEIIKETNTHSINLFAENCLNHIGLKVSGNPVSEHAADDVVSFWKSKGIDTQGMFLFDGSGLSRNNSFTTRQMVRILTFLKDSSANFEHFYSSLPIGGQTGTLKNLFKDVKVANSIRAKSGTINRVKAYSGYIHSLSGRDIAFSMMVNDFSCSSREATKKLEKLMIALAEFKK